MKGTDYSMELSFVGAALFVVFVIVDIIIKKYRKD